MQSITLEALGQRQLIWSSHEQSGSLAHAVKLGIGLVAGFHNPVLHALLTLIGVESHIIVIGIGDSGQQLVLLNIIVGPSRRDKSAPYEIIYGSGIDWSVIHSDAIHLVPIQGHCLMAVGGSQILHGFGHIRTDIDGHLLTLQSLARLIVRNGLVGVLAHIVGLVNKGC